MHNSVKAARDPSPFIAGKTFCFSFFDPMTLMLAQVVDNLKYCKGHIRAFRPRYAPLRFGQAFTIATFRSRQNPPDLEEEI